MWEGWEGVEWAMGGGVGEAEGCAGLSDTRPPRPCECLLLSTYYMLYRAGLWLEYPTVLTTAQLAAPFHRQHPDWGSGLRWAQWSSFFPSIELRPGAPSLPSSQDCCLWI